MRRHFIALPLVLCTSLAGAAGLGPIDRQYVDSVSIDPNSGIVTLLLVVDRPLEDGLTKQSAKRKLLGYAQWLKGPRFTKQFPQAKPEATVNVLIAHMPPRTALGRSVLEQIEGYAKELGFKPFLKQLAAAAPSR